MATSDVLGLVRAALLGQDLGAFLGLADLFADAGDEQAATLLRGWAVKKIGLRLENPAEGPPEVVPLDQLPPGEPGLLVAISHDDPVYRDMDFDHREDAEGIRLGLLGRWVQLACHGDGLYYLDLADVMDREEVREAWVRRLAPGERLVWQRGT